MFDGRWIKSANVANCLVFLTCVTFLHPISVVPPHGLEVGSVHVVIIKEPSQGTYKTSSLLTFPEELIEFLRLRLKVGFADYAAKNLEFSLFVCHPLSRSYDFCVTGLCISSACASPLCFWRTRWAASGPSVQRSIGPHRGPIHDVLPVTASLYALSSTSSPPHARTHAAALGSANQYER